jgi:TM2 domain-containing membrane protein YozV
LQKSAGLAAVLSFLIPGVGQIYNGQILKGLIIFAVQAINAALTSVLIGFITYPIVLIYAVYDAYRTAERINARQGGRSGF